MGTLRAIALRQGYVVFHLFIAQHEYSNTNTT
jgi:hypothetical protein